VQQAVVYDPSRNDLFYASRGKGAYLNDRRLRVSKRTRMLDSLIGTGFPFRKGDNFQRYMKMFEEVMVQCAGLRRPGAASLDLCYVAAGYYDGFFETGLSPWDIAAGSLMITEAGGLVGNFTGESDFLYQREIVAGNPRIYGQLVKTLAPYSRVITETAEEAGERAEGVDPEQDAEDDATIAALQAAEDAAHTAKLNGDEAPAVEEPKPVVRRRITAAAKAEEDAERARNEPAPRGRRHSGNDAPF
jgi:myo-inositol-1(or 4)-monophosphatase